MSSLFRRSLAAVLSVGIVAGQLIAPATAANQAAVTISMPVMLDVPFTLYGQWNTDSNWHDSLDVILTTMDQKTVAVDPATVATLISGYAPSYAAQIQTAFSNVKEANATVSYDGVTIKGSVSDLSALAGQSLDKAFEKIYDVDPNFNLQGLNLSADVSVSVETVNHDVTTQKMMASGLVTVSGTSYPLMFDASIYDTIAEKYQVVLKDVTALRDQKLAAAQAATTTEEYQTQTLAAEKLTQAIAKLTEWSGKLQTCVARAHADTERVFAASGTYTAASGAAVVDQILAKVNQLIDEKYDAATGRVEGYPMLDAYVQKYGDKAVSMVPKTAAEAAQNQKLRDMYATFEANVTKLMPEQSVYDLSIDDCMTLLSDSYDAKAVVDNRWMTLSFSIADAQNASGELVALAASNNVVYAGLADAYRSLYKTELPQGAVFTDAKTHKLVTAEGGLNAQNCAEAGYHVTRVIDALEIEVPDTTTTTTTTSSTTSTTTTGTTTSSTGTTTTTTGTTTSSSSSTTTTTSSSSTTTTTTTTSTSSSTTTTSTSSSTTTTSTSTSTSTTTTTTEFVQYQIIVQPEDYHTLGTYWSEDTNAVDLSGLGYLIDLHKISLDASGAEQDDGIAAFGSDAAIDGSLLVAQSPSALAYKGHGAYLVDVSLTQEVVDLVSDYILRQNLGFTAEDLTKAGLVAGNVVAQETVQLVLRGDCTLNETVDAIDATVGLSWYVAYYVAEIPEEQAKAEFVADPNNFKDAIYAGDVDSSKELKVVDATFILNYYVSASVAEQKVTWVDIIGSDVKPTWH